jgi:anti-anti-sigma factor
MLVDPAASELRAFHGSVRVTPGQLVVFGGLELDDRREFISATTIAIDRAEGNVALDCSQLETIDSVTLGMLVALSRAAGRRGTRLVLEAASPRVRSDVASAGVSHMFDWSA